MSDKECNCQIDAHDYDCPIHNTMLPVASRFDKRPVSGVPAPSPIDVFWREVARGWSIESRDWFEANYLARGYPDPVTMAVHHMWKRNTKPLAPPATQEGQENHRCGYFDNGFDQQHEHRMNCRRCLLDRIGVLTAAAPETPRQETPPAPSPLAERLEALEKLATPGEWEGHIGEDVTGYPCYFLHGFSGDEKRDMARHQANLNLAIELRNHLPEILAALRRREGVTPDETDDDISRASHNCRARMGEFDHCRI